MADGTSDDPTQIYRPAPPPAGPPTEAIPAQPGAPGTAAAGGPGGPGGSGGIGDGIGDGTGSGGPNPLVLALVAAIAVLAVLIIVLLIVTHKKSNPTTAATTTTTSSSTSSSTTSTSSTVPATLPPLPTSTTTTSAPTTTVPAAGHRAPSPAERDKIVQDSSAGSNPIGPDAVVDGIWISNSDQTWALLHVSPAAGHANDVQPGYQIRNYVNGMWTFVSAGTTGPQCAAAVPSNVRADFASLPIGSCSGG